MGLKPMQVMTLLFAGEMTASHWFMMDFGLGMFAFETPPGGSFCISITCHGHATVGHHANHHLCLDTAFQPNLDPSSSCQHRVSLYTSVNTVLLALRFLSIIIRSCTYKPNLNNNTRSPLSP